jgi:hypothetical protein
MGVDVVGTVVRVILGYEDGGVFPVAAVRDDLDQPSEREAIVRHVGLRREFARGGALRVIVGKPDELECRQVPARLIGAELPFPLGLPLSVVGAVRVVTRKKGIDVVAKSRLQAGRAGGVRSAAAAGARRRLGELAVVAEADAVVRKAKSETKVSMRAEVAEVSMSGRGADLVRLGEQDLRAAGNIGDLTLAETEGDLAVEVVLG